MRSVTRFATLLFATAALAACEDKADFSNVVVPNVALSIGGTWNLQTINGLVLPRDVDLGSGTVSLTASTLTLVAANSTSGTFTLTITTDGATPSTATTTGNYTLNGAVLTLVSTDTPPAVTVTGSFNGGNTLTLTLNGNTAVYTRQ